MIKYFFIIRLLINISLHIISNFNLLVMILMIYINQTVYEAFKIMIVNYPIKNNS